MQITAVILNLFCVRDTDERMLIDVDDNVSWNDLFDWRDRDGNGISQFDDNFLIL